MRRRCWRRMQISALRMGGNFVSVDVVRQLGLITSSFKRPRLRLRRRTAIAQRASGPADITADAGGSWCSPWPRCGCGFEPVQVLSPGDLAGADLLLAPGADLAGVDFAGADLAVTPGADLAGVDLATKPCAQPQLLVTVENLQNSGSGGGARGEQLQLGDGSNLPQSCSTLSAQGGITAQPFSVAQVAGKLAVEGIDDLQLIDPGTDTMLWTKPNNAGDFPVDVFALSHPNGQVLVAAAWGNTGQSMPAITHIDAWDNQAATLTKSWMTNGVDLPLGLGIYGVCAHSQMPTLPSGARPRAQPTDGGTWTCGARPRTASSPPPAARPPPSTPTSGPPRCASCGSTPAAPPACCTTTTPARPGCSAPSAAAAARCCYTRCPTPTDNSALLLRLVRRPQQSTRGAWVQLLVVGRKLRHRARRRGLRRAESHVAPRHRPVAEHLTMKR